MVTIKQFSREKLDCIHDKFIHFICGQAVILFIEPVFFPVVNNSSKPNRD